MPLSAGTRLGPYEVLSLLGTGGMGEVYRARDERLRREVALKVLPASIAQDADRLRRFESEARAASALNHPNIVTVHDIGRSNGTTYMAMELVDGSSLRQILAGGALGEKKMLEVAVQIADGLAKAHSAGIVHRDMKPENVMVSRDGFVKLLDFGLAKPFAAPGTGDGSAIPTIVGETLPGTVLGTVGYMSPEQASGKPVDYRSDQFSLGSILYEMATGNRAFQKPTGAETLSAIIREEPDPVSRVNPRAPAPYRWIVERCLAKDPEDRYASTRDLARDLKSVREHVSEVTSTASGAMTTSPAARRRALGWWIAAAALVLGLGGGVLLDRRLTKVEPPSFRQLTFRRGTIASARFTPDGQTILLTAMWDGAPLEIYSRRLESPDARSMGVAGTQLLGVSPSGEMAVSSGTRVLSLFQRAGRLGTMSIAAVGAPRDILDDVQWADWSPDGKEMAVIREESGRARLEYPIGKPVFQTGGWISHARIAPSGDSVAFCHHPTPGDDGGEVSLVNRSGQVRKLAGDFASLQGLAWSPSGEVWFTAASGGANRALYSVTRSGRVRLVARVTGTLTIHDFARDGRALVSNDRIRQSIVGRGPTDEKERDFGWLDFPSGRDLSADGTLLLFDESGEGGGPGYSVYIRKTDGSPATRLGDGVGWGFSPDGRWALAVRGLGTRPEVVLYPTGVGEPRPVPTVGLLIQSVDWMPDAKSILLTASEPGHGSRLFLLDLVGGKPKAISPEGYRSIRHGVSPDGKLAIVSGPDQRSYLYPTSSGEPQTIPGATPQDRIEGWTADGKSLVIHRRGELPSKVYKLDPATGKKELWKELMPADTAGLADIGGVLLGKDGKSYTYGGGWVLSDLFLVEGLK